VGVEHELQDKLNYKVELSAKYYNHLKMDSVCLAFGSNWFLKLTQGVK
jgi:hypothetical protein